MRTLEETWGRFPRDATSQPPGFNIYVWYVGMGDSRGIWVCAWWSTWKERHAANQDATSGVSVNQITPKVRADWWQCSSCTIANGNRYETYIGQGRSDSKTIDASRGRRMEKIQPSQIEKESSNPYWASPNIYCHLTRVQTLHRGAVLYTEAVWGLDKEDKWGNGDENMKIKVSWPAYRSADTRIAQ